MEWNIKECAGTAPARLGDAARAHRTLEVGEVTLVLGALPLAARATLLAGRCGRFGLLGLSAVGNQGEDSEDQVAEHGEESHATTGPGRRGPDYPMGHVTGLLHT